MKFIKSFFAFVEIVIGTFLGLFAVVVALLMASLFFIAVAEVAIIVNLFKNVIFIISNGQSLTGQVIFLMLEMVDLTLVSILVVIIATSAFRIISEMIYGPVKDENVEKSISLLNLSGKMSQNLEAKLIFSVIGLAAVSILGVIFEISSKIEKGVFNYKSIPQEYYIFAGGYLLLIITSVAVILLSKSDKE